MESQRSLQSAATQEHEQELKTVVGQKLGTKRAWLNSFTLILQIYRFFYIFKLYFNAITEQKTSLHPWQFHYCALKWQ